MNWYINKLISVLRACEEGHKITKGHTFEEEQNRLMENSKISQTSSEWKLKYELEDKEYGDLKKQLKIIFTRQQKRRHDIISKFKRKRKKSFSRAIVKLFGSFGVCRPSTCILYFSFLLTGKMHAKSIFFLKDNILTTTRGIYRF